MEFQQRLPQNLRETALFMTVISVLSVNIIAPVITGMEIGFSLEHWVMVLRQMPLLWAAVIILVILTQQPATKLASYFLGEAANFRSTMLITALCNVFLMSLVLTVVGTWIGTGQVTLASLQHFFLKWPRNFTIAFIVEAFVVQPLARLVMARIHGARVLG
ncbi:hypothetical protein [Levilactobacillus humaensis]|uniref:hypothetical protein n=1 Tax=Levilactobacillus humaensis TaxID=2950375 RepID=UPI0021C37447|nr:hypothetical protein [Levilactobacillus humaensis]